MDHLRQDDRTAAMYPQQYLDPRTLIDRMLVLVLVVQVVLLVQKSSAQHRQPETSWPRQRQRRLMSSDS